MTILANSRIEQIARLNDRCRMELDPKARIGVTANCLAHLCESTPASEAVIQARLLAAVRSHEFAPEFAEALIEQRRGGRFDDATADAGIASLKQPNDRVRVGAWIAMFLDQAASKPN